MKKHSKTLEIIAFLTIFLLLIIPGILSQFFTQTESLFASWNFPFEQIGLLVISIIILYLFSEHSSFSAIWIFNSIFCLCILFTIALIFKFLSLVLPVSSGNEISVNLPHGLLEWTFCILRFLIAAFYEEVIYRFYFPEALYSLFKTDKKIIVEITGMLVFGLGHIYLGIYTVLDACLSYFVLRYVFKKTNSIFPGFAAHFLYNMISLILL